jgi:uncharacterized protein (TIGR00106 family)
MLAEFSIMPMGQDAHTSQQLAEALKIVEESGLPYQLTPTATCLEGAWEEVLPVIRLCHARVRNISPHVVTMIKIEDDAGETEQLASNLSSVEEKAGRPLSKAPKG